MADIKKLNKVIDDYNKQSKAPKIAYEAIRNRLVKLVDKFSFEEVALASGLKESTVRQHYRNATGTSMVSAARLDKAETVLALYSKVCK